MNLTRKRVNTFRQAAMCRQYATHLMSQSQPHKALKRAYQRHHSTDTFHTYDTAGYERWWEEVITHMYEQGFDYPVYRDNWLFNGDPA
jgi:hypothetical protein